MGSNVFDFDAYLAKRRGGSSTPDAGLADADVGDIGVVPGMAGALSGALKRSRAKDTIPRNASGDVEQPYFDEEGHTLSYPHFPQPSDPGVSEVGSAALALGLGLSGGVRPLLSGLAGTALGGYGGHALGSGLERAGFPQGTAEVAGRLGGIGGGFAGAAGGPGMLAGLAEHVPTHSAVGAMSKSLLRYLAGNGATQAAVEAGPSQIVRDLMEGKSSFGKMTQEAAEQIAVAIEKQAGRGAATPAAAAASKSGQQIANEVAAARTTADVAKAVPSMAPKPTEVIPGFDTTQLMQLKTAWGNEAGRAKIREWLTQQAPEVQAQIKQFLQSNAMR